jgi:hypothetical protein
MIEYIRSRVSLERSVKFANGPHAISTEAWLLLRIERVCTHISLKTSSANDSATNASRL